MGRAIRISVFAAVGALVLGISSAALGFPTDVRWATAQQPTKTPGIGTIRQPIEEPVEEPKGQIKPDLGMKVEQPKPDPGVKEPPAQVRRNRDNGGPCSSLPSPEATRNADLLALLVPAALAIGYRRLKR